MAWFLYGPNNAVQISVNVHGPFVVTAGLSDNAYNLRCEPNRHLLPYQLPLN
jgi:hypothetical protein